MKSLYDFIISPLNKRYNNTTKIGDKDFVVNTNIENHLAVAKEAKVIAIPSAYKTCVKVGDVVKVHHNIFRRWYDVKGNERNSGQYFKEDLYFCKPDQIYLHKKGDTWMPFLNRCFVMPIKDTESLTLDVEKKCVGILKIGNNELEALLKSCPRGKCFLLNASTANLGFFFKM